MPPRCELQVKASISGKEGKDKEALKAKQEAKAAKEEQENAWRAVDRARTEHKQAAVNAQSMLDAEVKSAEAAWAQSAEELEATRRNLGRLRALEEASAAADVVRKQATAKRARAEVERRKDEEARMTVQGEAIARRPGGRQFFKALEA